MKPKTIKVKRSEGRRDSARPPPDRWSLARRAGRRARQTIGERLGPGQLDGLVLDYMRERTSEEPLGTDIVAAVWCDPQLVIFVIDAAGYRAWRAGRMV